MRSRRRATVSELREVIDCLPRKTKVAMLEGIRANEIIVGAYADGRGICPMLAAHRAGGRTSMIAFARAWDRFAFRDTRKRAARRATERELRVLRTHLEASLLEQEDPSPELAGAMAEHRRLLEERSSGERLRLGAADHAGDAAEGPGDAVAPDGWAWLRLFRRYDEYERALARVREESASGGGAERGAGGGDEQREPALVG